MIKSIYAKGKHSAGTNFKNSAIAIARGLTLSRYIAIRLMKEQRLVICQLPKHQHKKAVQEHIAISSTFERQFAGTKPNQVLCGDIMLIWTRNRWAYLAVFMDLFARKPVGLAMSYPLNAQELTMAYESRVLPENVMFHSV